jgi:hypothetical protein
MSEYFNSQAGEEEEMGKLLGGLRKKGSTVINGKS